MVKPRSRTTQPTEQEIEAFGNMAEQPRGPVDTSPSPAPAAPPKKRKDPKVTGYNFRMTAVEKQLLTRAALEEDISEQKILERLVWPALRERYADWGEDQP